MAKPFAEYLVNEETRKAFFLAVLFNTNAKRWEVCTGWGYKGTVFKEKIYSGGKSGDFNSEKNARAYADAIASTKRNEGFELDNDPEGEKPAWWESAVENDTDQYKGDAPTTAPAGLASRPPPPKTKDDESPGTSYVKKERDINKLKEKMEAKVKIEAGKAKIAVKQPEKEEEVQREQPRPRFGFAPRK